MKSPGKIQVFESYESVDSFAVVLFCKRVNLNIERHLIDLMTGKSLQEFIQPIIGLKSFPSIAKLPILVDNNVLVHGKNSILRYLSVRYASESRWYPKEFSLRAEIDSMLEFGKYMDTLLLQNAYLESIMGCGVSQEFSSNYLRDDAQKCLMQLNRSLKSQDFLCGAHITLADISLVFSVLRLKLIPSFELEYCLSIIKWTDDVVKYFGSDFADVAQSFGFETNKFVLSVPHPILQVKKYDHDRFLESKDESVLESDDEDREHYYHPQIVLNEHKFALSEGNGWTKIDTNENFSIRRHSSHLGYFHLSHKVHVDPSFELIGVKSSIFSSGLIASHSSEIIHYDNCSLFKCILPGFLSFCFQFVQDIECSKMDLAMKGIPPPRGIGDSIASMNEFPFFGWSVKLEDTFIDIQYIFKLEIPSNHPVIVRGDLQESIEKSFKKIIQSVSSDTAEA